MRDIPLELAQKFLDLFPCSPAGYYRGKPTDKVRADGKKLWDYTAVYRPIDLTAAIHHLGGNISIVGIPLMDSVVQHAGIDIDEYGTLDPSTLQSRIVDLGLGEVLHLFPTKSDGFRLIVFFREPQPANKVRRLLRNWVAKLGFPGTEVFPKQDTAGKLGNGYNLPFFGQPDELASFEPTYYETPLANWDLGSSTGNAQSSIPSEGSVGTAGSFLQLRRDVELRSELLAAGLQLAEPHAGSFAGVGGVFHGYHGLAGQPCFISGSVHPANATNPRCSAFFVTIDNRVVHTCFDDDPRGTSKTRAALSKLNLTHLLEDGVLSGASSDGYFHVFNGHICMWKVGKEPIRVSLSNFVARIKRDVVVDDGAEQKLYHDIAGVLEDGIQLQVQRVPVERFASLSWVSNWGGRAIISAGPSKRDLLREGMQVLSGNIERETVYAHTGWHLVEDQYVFLHTGGAIGADYTTRDDIKVDLSTASGAKNRAFADYELPVPSTGLRLKAALAASLAIRNVGPATVIVPHLAAAYRAPLCECCPVDLSVVLTGPTGAQKTEMQALVQQHFGARWQRLNLPLNWSGTANFISRSLHMTKDVIAVIDDFVPDGGSRADTQQLHQKAEQVFRGTGNHAGRGRLNSNIEVRPTYYPRGLVLSSGEDTPRGHSLNARLFICDLNKGDINLAALTRAQEDGASGLFAEAMSSYVSWLAPQILELKKTLPQRLKELRSTARTAVAIGHDRTPEAVASLALGLEMFLRFALEADAIDVEQKRRLWSEGWAALLESSKGQHERQQDQEGTNRLLSLLRGAIASGRAHVASAKSGGPPPKELLWGWRALSDGGNDNNSRNDADEIRAMPLGRCVGWLEGSNLYLEPEAALAAVQTFAQEQGAAFPWTAYTTWQRFKNKGLLLSHGENRSESRVTICRHRRYVIHIPADLVVCASQTDEDDADDQTQDGFQLTEQPVAPIREGDILGTEAGVRNLARCAKCGSSYLHPLSAGGTECVSCGDLVGAKA